MSLTAADLGIPVIFNAATRFVDRNVEEGRGDHVAIECGDERITYAQVLARANRFGSALRTALDVRPEERIVLLLTDGPAFAYCFFGAIKIGAVPIPLNTLWTAGGLPVRARRLARVGARRQRVAAAADRTDSALNRQSLRHIVVAGAQTGLGDFRLEEILESGSAELDAEPTSRDAPAFWLYSSGSTGTPKGCVHLQHDMAVCAELFGRRVLGLRPEDRTFSVAKLFFAYGLGNALYMPFSVGATTILWPGAPAPQAIYEVIERHRPTLFYSVPTGYAMMLAQNPPADRRDYDLSSVRLAVSAGEALPPALYERFKQRFGVDILDGIGSTEVLHMFIANRPDAIRPGSSGLVVPGYDARLLGDDREPVAPGEIGNLWIDGDSTCACYWNQHDKTRETIEGRWIRTGDKYTQDADDYFWYAGRADDMLKVGGLWVSPVEVENALIRARRSARERRRRARRSRWPDEAAGVRRAARGLHRFAGSGEGVAAVRP